MRLAFGLFLSAVALASPATANPFDGPPERYDETLNPALQQIGSDLRIRQISCIVQDRCRFTARQVGIEVTGPADRPGTQRITIEATFRRGNDGAAQELLDDALTVLGATMMAYDPGLEAERRGELLFALGDAALGTGEGHEDSADVHYAVSFDNTSGRLAITAATIRAGHG